MTIEHGRMQLSNGIDPLELVQKYGAPLYVYDAAVIERQYQRLHGAFKVKSLRLNFACKALTNLSVLRLMKKLGSGLDTVSIQEVQMGLMAGFAPQEIMFTPSGVSLAEMEAAVNLGVRINVDNLPMLEQFGLRFPQVPVCIRVNPHIMAGGNLQTSVGHVDSKFGISVHQLPLVKRIMDNTGLKMEGIHMHTGSDILQSEAFMAGTELLLNAAKDYPELSFVNLGSGFKVPYKPNDVETDIEDLGEKISTRFKAFCKAYGRELTLVFEPGKFLVSEAGSFLVRVNAVKQTTSTVFACVDSGFNHLIRPMFYGSYHKISNLSNPNGKIQHYNIVGYICETDTFAANRPLSEVHEGDILCFHNAGAYCFSMANNYNSRLLPAEVMIYQGKDHLIRERQTLDDLLRNQVQIEI
jgi:diaminopimelate decarboxylase